MCGRALTHESDYQRSSNAGCNGGCHGDTVKSMSHDQMLTCWICFKKNMEINLISAFLVHFAVQFFWYVLFFQVLVVTLRPQLKVVFTHPLKVRICRFWLLSDYLILVSFMYMYMCNWMGDMMADQSSNLGPLNL